MLLSQKPNQKRETLNFILSFLFSLLAETTGAAAPIGCGIIQINTYPLEDMTRGTANAYLIVLAGVIPLAVATTGFFVLRRRSHK